MLLVGSDSDRRFVTPMRPELPKLMPARVSSASVGGTRTPEQGRRSRTRNTHRVRRMSTLPARALWFQHPATTSPHLVPYGTAPIAGTSTSDAPSTPSTSCPTAPRLSLATSTSDAPSPAEVNRRHTTRACSPETVPHGTNPQLSVILGYTTKYPMTRCPLLGHLMP